VAPVGHAGAVNATPWLALVAVGYLPGALIYRLPMFDRPFRARLAVEERIFWHVVISVAGSLAIVLGLGLAGRYTFARLVGLDLGLSAVVLLGWRGRLGYGGEAARSTWAALIPLGLVLLAAPMYLPTAEYVIGGRDPGAYLNEGVQLAQRGQILVHDPTVAAVPPALRGLFYPQHRGQPYYGVRFMGFFIQDPDSGQVVGQFPHLFPASIAVGYALNGLDGARQTSAAWTLLALVAVYLVGLRTFGPAAAAAAAGLLAINVITVWFARYPNSEIPMQALLFAAALAFGRALEGGRLFFGPLAGALLGLLLFLRYDALIAIGAFLLAAAIAPAARVRTGVGFAVVAFLLSLAGLAYLSGPMRAYFAYPLAFIQLNTGWGLVALGLVSLAAIRVAMTRPRVQALVHRAAPPLYAAVLAGLAFYAYFFRAPAGRTAEFDAMSFRVFAWYTTPWGLAAAVAGVMVASWRRFWRAPAFFLLLAAFSLFFFYKTRIVPEHFWTMRRFLAVTLPGAALCIGALADSLGGPERMRAWFARPGSGAHARFVRAAGVLVVALLVAPLAGAFWTAAGPVRPHVEYAGIIPRLERLAAQVGDRDLLIVESRNAGSDLHVIALPLAYIYGRQVLVLDSAAPSKRLLEAFLTWAWTHYDHVLYLGGGGTDLLTTAFSAEPVSSERFAVPEYERPVNAYPSGVRRKDFEYGMYRLVPAAAHAASEPVDVRIGVLDDLDVLRFHARETRGDTGETFRWTTGQSFVLLLGIPTDATTLTIWMSNGGRPAAAPPATVEAAFDDDTIGTATPDDQIRPYTFHLAPALVSRVAGRPDPVRLRLRVPTWNPAATIGGGDTRDLGVIVTRVDVR
jgi:hypothetical protein